MIDTPLLHAFQKIFVRALTYLFLLIALIFLVSSIAQSFIQFLAGDELTQIVVKLVNAGIIAMAVFEVASVISTEYGAESGQDVIVMLRRTLPRFIGTVCVALSLEGLMMVIKYSQLELAGNLFYPVAIVLSAAGLLMGLGVFLRLAPRRDEPQTVAQPCAAEDTRHPHPSTVLQHAAG